MPPPAPVPPSLLAAPWPPRAWLWRNVLSVIVGRPLGDLDGAAATDVGAESGG